MGIDKHAVVILQPAHAEGLTYLCRGIWLDEESPECFHFLKRSLYSGGGGSRDALILGLVTVCPEKHDSRTMGMVGILR